MTEDSELKPCPFCGYEHIQVLGRDISADMCPDATPENVRMLWRANCSNCGADHDCHDKREYAVEAWNTRAPLMTSDNQLVLCRRLTKLPEHEGATGYYYYVPVEELSDDDEVYAIATNRAFIDAVENNWPSVAAELAYRALMAKWNGEK